MKQQTIRRSDDRNTPRWLCDDDGWIPHEALELLAEQFPENTIVIVKIPDTKVRNTVARRDS